MFWTSLKFGTRCQDNVTGTPAKFQSDVEILHPNLVPSRFHEIFQENLLLIFETDLDVLIGLHNDQITI